MATLNSRKQILYVEDNGANRWLLKVFFDRQNHLELHLADTAEQGEEMVSQQLFDLILMDLSLPGMDGKELTQRLRNKVEFKHIPIVALTAAAMTHDIEAAENLFDNYIIKPVDFAILTEILQKHL